MTSDDLDDRARTSGSRSSPSQSSPGGDWPDRAAAALRLSTGDEREDDSTTALLIRDIRPRSSRTDENTYKTADLLTRLHEIEESPWGDWYGSRSPRTGCPGCSSPTASRRRPSRQ